VDQREYNQMDLRYLVPFRAPLDNEQFKARYFKAQDVWARMFPSGAMPAARLQSLVEDWENDKARELTKQPKKEKALA
jgi:hypothetical protein